MKKELKMSDTNQNNKFAHFSHSPFKFEWRGVVAEVGESGKIKITQEHDDDTFDEIETSADFIYRLASMLSATKKKEMKDVPYGRDK